MESNKANSLEDLFVKVSTLIRETPVTAELQTVSTDQKLRLYGLYKHVTQGPCDKAISAPSRLAIEAYAKYSAWKACRDMNKASAMLEYVEIASSQPHWLGAKCQTMLEAYRQQNPLSSLQEDSKASMETNMIDKNEAISALEDSWLRKWCGWGAMEPRGQLDISYADLGFGARQCLVERESRPRYRHYEDAIRQQWRQATGRDALVALSARSILDLYLLVKEYPAGAQIILAPGINVPGMLHVLKHHELEIVSVDLPVNEKGESVLGVDVEAVAKAITSQTVAILVTHPFGIIATGEAEMRRLKHLCLEHELDLLEDCAECYTGLGETTNNACYKGSAHADLVLFSFGFIKTATALGGGVAVASRPELIQAMHLKQGSVYKDQTRSEFWRLVVAAVLIRILCDLPLFYGLVYFCTQCLGWNFDALVLQCIRGFPSCSNTSERLFFDPVMARIRRRPCTVLLSLLRRRLQAGTKLFPSARRRMQQCDKFRLPIESKILVTSKSASRTHWIFPMRNDNPELLCKTARRHGFDVTRGSSQLVCTGQSSECPRAFALMESIVYLPLSSRSLPSAKLNKLRAILATPSETMSRAVTSNSFPQLHGLDLRIIVPIVAAAWCLPWNAWTQVLRISWYAVAALFAVFVCGCVWVQHTMSSFYLESSDAFAKYGRNLSTQMIGKSDSKQSQESPLLSTIDALQVPKHAQGLSRNVILTGSTGYIGKALLRDLLFHRKELGIGQIILISRPKRGFLPRQRIDLLLEDPMFSFLPLEQKTDIVRVIGGDVTQENGAIESSVLEQLTNDHSVSHLIHCAAAVSFTQSLEDAARANISSALHMQKLAGSFASKAVKFVHVSTAFVHGGETGTRDAPLPESLYSLRHFDAAEIYHSMTGTQFYAASAMRELGFPNTYTFSKCVCENLLSRSTVETLIVRPSIVGPAMYIPTIGWAGSKPSTLVAAACLYFVYQWNLWFFGEHLVPCIPVDILSKFIIRRAFEKPDAPISLQNEEAMSSDDDFDKVSEPEISSVSTDSVASVSRVQSAPGSERFTIFNAAWDVESDRKTQFTWVDYAVSVTQLGSVMGKFSRPAALVGLFFTTKLLPALNLSIRQYEHVHTFLVVYPFALLLRLCGLLGQDLRHMMRLQPFLDLPLLFFPFMTRDFYFKSSLVAPDEMRGDQYLFSCTVAAYKFVEQDTSKRKNGVSSRSLSTYTVAGRRCIRTLTDLSWVLTQPNGGLAIRLFAWVIVKLLRVLFVEVTVDLESFTNVEKGGPESGRIVLVPTHRSFLDFILLSFLFFSVPEVHIDIPFIAAAAEFSQVPLVSWLVRLGRAFFVRRNHGQVDPVLGDTIRRIYETTGSPVFEVFIEGRRSRDRRFVSPKTGFLKCLREHARDELLVVPVTINYERIPEQGHLSRDAASFRVESMKLSSLLWWLLDCVQGKVSLGRAHISAGLPLEVRGQFEKDFNKIANEIQYRQQKDVLVSSFHVACGSQILGIEQETLRRALAVLGVCRWDTDVSEPNPLQLPQDTSELWTVFLQCSHILGPLVITQRPRWGSWLLHSCPQSTDDELLLEQSVFKLVRALVREFDAADLCVQKSLKQLKANGFDSPIDEHVLEVAGRIEGNVPRLLLYAALSFVSSGDERVEDSCVSNLCDTSLAGSILQSEERLGFWGYADSSFVVNLDSNGVPIASMRGGRYRNKNDEIKGLVAFVERETGVKIDPMCEAFRKSESSGKVHISESPFGLDDLSALGKAVEKLSLEEPERLRHGSGHAIDDVFHIRNGDQLRAPDVVVWPANEDEVESIIRLAAAKNWCIIPFGGGTNVSHATRCPPVDVEPRPIVSMDITLLNKVLWVDRENMLAHVQAGIRGGDLVRKMSRRGYTIGHEPDSIEFSTLGGWIATKASGMKRSKYGNIEDIVKGVSVVTPQGCLHHGDKDKSVWGRTSTGLDLESLILGSEGCLGVITSAVIRIWPLPQRQQYEGILFSDLNAGIDFVRDVARIDGEKPASCRLLDNEHFRLGIALRSDPKSMIRTAKGLLEKLFLRHTGFKADECVCATITYEGSQRQVSLQKCLLTSLARKHGGILLGQESGKNGYDLTFLIAYLRDFALSFYLMGESFETFASWSTTKIIIDRVKERVRKEHEKRCLPGHPFVGCRVTQLYNEGACLYFYLCISCHRVPKPTEVFAEIEKAARQEILKLGGSLSHHHGVGKIRAQFLPSLNSTTFHGVQHKIKECLDPLNIFGARNGVYADQTQQKEKLPDVVS